PHGRAPPPRGGVGEEPQRSVKARLAGTIRAGDQVQPIQWQHEVTQRSIPLDGQRSDHRRRLATTTVGVRHTLAVIPTSSPCPSRPAPESGSRSPSTWPSRCRPPTLRPESSCPPSALVDVPE